MSKVSREKIALVVFAALIAVSLCGLIGYLAIGHSWNVAASNIDDATGRMDGYTTIVFRGTVDPTLAKEAIEPDSEKRSPEISLPDRDSEKTGQQADPASQQSSGAQKSAQDSTDDAEARSANESGLRSAGDVEQRVAAEEGAEEGDIEGEDAVSADGSSKQGKDGEVSSPPATKKVIPVDLVDIEKSYFEKNATVFELDTLHPDVYSEGVILRKGEHRFGVFSATPATTARMIAAHVAYFDEHEVDFIVALTSGKEIVEEAVGIDIVISTQDEGLFVMGETIDGTFYVNAPELGSAGVILISPSNVVSAKVVQAS